MSAGIIHEINNPLNFATTGLFTLRNKNKHVAEEHRPEFAEILKDIEEGVKRVKNIVSDLRSFRHPNAEMMEEGNGAAVVTTAVRFAGNELNDRVQIHQQIPKELTLEANKIQITQLSLTL